MGKFNFRLYKKEQGIFPFEDYAVLLDMAKGKNSVLEFGPGYSTRAFIEAGVPVIISCEHDLQWLKKSVTDYRQYPSVGFCRYYNTPVVTIPWLYAQRFDLAFVDSPLGSTSKKYKPLRVIHPGQEGLSRYNTLLYAYEHADMVILHDAEREDEQNSLVALTRLHNCRVERAGAKLAIIYKE